MTQNVTRRNFPIYLYVEEKGIIFVVTTCQLFLQHLKLLKKS